MVLIHIHLSFQKCHHNTFLQFHTLTITILSTDPKPAIRDLRNRRPDPDGR